MTGMLTSARLSPTAVIYIIAGKHNSLASIWLQVTFFERNVTEVEGMADSGDRGLLYRLKWIGCWLAGVLWVIGGLGQLVDDRSWANERVGGAIWLVAGFAIIPPILRRIRERLAIFRPMWAPAALLLISIPLGSYAPLPFRPSAAAREKELQAVMSEARLLLRSGKPVEADRVLSKFALRGEKGEPFQSLQAQIRKRIAARILDEDNRRAAESVPRVPPQTRVQKPSDPASDFVERINTYWMAEVLALPTVAPNGEAEYGALVTTLDRLSLNLLGSEKLRLSHEQDLAKRRYVEALSAKPERLLPSMRARYAEQLNAKLFRHDISVAAVGDGNRTLRLVGRTFARNANIEDVQRELMMPAAKLRFRRIEFRWSHYVNETTWYKIDSPSDGAVGTFEGAGQFRPAS